MTLGRTSLFELLGRAVPGLVSDQGTYYTDSPETYDDAGLLPGIEEYGTSFTRADFETYDDDALASLM